MRKSFFDNPRTFWTLIFLFSFLPLMFALYSQYFLHHEPCPLCLAERIVVAGIAVISLLFLLLNPKRWVLRVCSLLTAIIAGFGIKLAAHHLYLINLPLDQQPASCGLPLATLYQILPLSKFIKVMLQGSQECGVHQWKVLGIYGALWVLVIFIIILLISLYLTFSKVGKLRKA